MSDSQAREREEVAVVGPDLLRTVLDGRQRDLQVEDARPLDVAVDGECQEAVGDAGPRRPELSPTALHEGEQEGGGLGSASARLSVALPASQWPWTSRRLCPWQDPPLRQAIPRLPHQEAGAAVPLPTLPLTSGGALPAAAIDGCAKGQQYGQR